MANGLEKEIASIKDMEIEWDLRFTSTFRKGYSAAFTVLDRGDPYVKGNDVFVEIGKRSTRKMSQVVTLKGSKRFLPWDNCLKVPFRSEGSI